MYLSRKSGELCGFDRESQIYIMTSQSQRHKSHTIYVIVTVVTQKSPFMLRVIHLILVLYLNHRGEVDRE